MTPDVALAVLAAAFVHASWNALLKGTRDPVLGAAWLSAGTVAVAALLLPWLPLPAAPSWTWLGASLVVHLAYMSLLALTYRVAELGPAYTLMRGLPPTIVAVVVALGLGEAPSVAGQTGIVTVSAGLVLLGFGRDTRPQRKALLLALGVAATIATYTVLDAQGVRCSGHAASYVLWHGGLQGVSYFAGVLALRGRAVFRVGATEIARGTFAGAVAVAGYGVVLWAMTRAPIAMVSAMRETSVVFATVLGAVWLREPLGTRRLLAAALVAAGVALMQLGR